jgi:uncharacterized protein
MVFSKHNIFSKIKDSDNYFLLNPLSKNADILSPEKAKELLGKNYSGKEEYIEKGYLIDEGIEKKLFKQAYLDFIDERDNGEVQIFFVPTYSCNFSCSYCYQEGYEGNTGNLGSDTIDAFFKYLGSELKDRDKYITIFGGEPLLPSSQSKENMIKLISRATQENLDIAIVTNGYHLSEYIEILNEGKIREVQVTLDGVEEIHDQRRMLKNGNGTFKQIVQGINDTLNAGISINLRVVIDKDNIDHLPEIAKFAIKQGWTSNPLFKTQLGRNYELHYCQSEHKKLLERAEMYEKIYSLIKNHPEILEFHKPAYSISRFIFDNGEMPEPLFDACPGTKTEWAFDYTGRIYSCTATVGKVEESLGTYYPEITKKDEIIEEWEERDVTTIPECKECNLQLACGGGCASVAKNKYGKLNSPDCRPVKELLEMGISLYFNEGEE